MSERGKITVSKLAREAGVSPATVSRVLNHRTDLVTKEKIRQVETAMARLGCDYPTPTAKSPEHERPVIILNVPNINNLFYTDVINGASMSATSHGCHLLLNQSSLDYASMDVFFNMLERIHAAGVILTNPISADRLQLINNVVPVIQCCEFNAEAPIAYVSIDDCKAAREATEYLISSGRNKIAFINGPSSFKYATERLKGFLQAMEQAHLTVPSNWIVQLPEINYDMAYSSICQILAEDVKPNAFFTASDTLAAAVLRAAKRYHYRVPQDISVVGFDNTSTALICTPSLTTVNQPTYQEGFTACEMLVKKIGTPGSEPRSILLETELIVRESS